MGYDLWNHSKFLQHKVRNMTRRGWLLKTYNKGKMLKARVKSGKYIENDEIDIIHPVGYVAHVKGSGKHEVLTMDVGADTSRRVVMTVMGDRENVPQPDENEAFLYAPDDKKMFMRFKKQRSQQQRANGGKDSSGNQDSGRPDGMHWDGKDQKVSGTTEDTFQNNAEGGQGYSTGKNFTVKAGANTQMEASKHARKGDHYRDGTDYVKGVVHAADHKAGGSATVSPSSARAGGRDDGSQGWGVSGQEGSVSLLETAAGLTQTTQQLNNFEQAQTQTNQQQAATNQQTQQHLSDLNQQLSSLDETTSGALQELHDMILALEQRVSALEQA